MKAGKTALPAPNGPASKGVVVTNSRGGAGKKARLWVSRKEFEQGLLCLSEALPKMKPQI